MPVDDQTRLMTLDDLLKETEFVMGEDGGFYAAFFREGHQVTYPTFSPDFMTWIRGESAERLSSIPSNKVIKQAIEQKEHKVRLKDHPYPVGSRFYADETSVVILLGVTRSWRSTLNALSPARSRVSRPASFFPPGTP